MTGRGWWRPAFRSARCAAVGSAVLVSFGITGLVTLAAPASPAAAAPASTPSAPENLNPDCALSTLQENVGDEIANGPGGLLSALGNCSFSIDSYSLTKQPATTQGTPVNINLGWSDFTPSPGDLAGGTTPTVSIDVDWGDGTTSTYDIGGNAGSEQTNYNVIVANCSSTHMVASSSNPGWWDCKNSNPDGTSPISHNYAASGNYSVSVTATLFLAADYCPSLSCPSVGPPPYYVTSDNGNAVTANVVVGHALPSVSFVHAPAAGTPAPPTSPQETAAVGQKVGLSIETSDLDPTAYYHLYLDWGDGDKVAVIPLDSPNPGSGVMDFTPVDPDLNHAYQHPGTYKVTATIVPCTLGLGTRECDETTPTNFVATSVTIGPAPVAVEVQAVETATQTNPTFTYTSSLPYGGTLPAGVSVTGSATCTSVNGGTLLSQPLAVGTYTVDRSSCSGLSISDTTDYSLTYVGSVISTTGIVVNVTGNGTYDYLAAPETPFSLSATPQNLPSGVTISGTVHCSKTTTGLPIGDNSSGTGVISPLGGSYKIDGSSCSGLTASDSTYTIDYVGGALTLTPGETETDVSVSVPGGGTPVYGQPVTLTATTYPAVPGLDGTFDPADRDFVAARPTGTVQFYDNGNPVGAPVSVDAENPNSGLLVTTLTTSDLAPTQSCLTSPGGGGADCFSFSGDLITAKYSGDNDYQASTSAAYNAPSGVQVGIAGTTTSVAASTTSAVYGQAVTLTASVNPIAPSGSGLAPSGSVQFYDNGAPLGDPVSSDTAGTASLTTTLPITVLCTPPGLFHSCDAGPGDQITAQYFGSDQYSGSMAPTTGAPTVAVGLGQTTTTVTAPSSSSVFTAPVTLTAAVSAVAPSQGTPTGSVTFTDGNTVLGSASLADGVATLTTASLAVGAHSITASYDGDGNFGNSTSQSLSQTVKQAPTALSLGSTPNPSSVWGQSVTFTATVVVPVPGAGGSTGIATFPAGTVTFSEGSTVLGTGTLNTTNGVTSATFTTASLDIGAHSITASYGGDGNYEPSTAQEPLSQSVNQAATTLSLGSTPNPSIHGQTATFTATVAPVSPGAGVPTGMVTFKDGNSPLGTGTLSTANGVTTATLTTSSLALGTHTITTAYNGDAHFRTSSTITTQYVDTSLSSYPLLPSGAHNLANANLSGGYLLDLSLVAASLANSNFTGAHFNLANLTSANLSNGNFKNAVFTGANLTGANLTSANLYGATGLSTATLTNVHWYKTTCPDGTLSNSDGGTCLGHL